MNLAPLLHAAPLVRLHAGAAMAAFGLGLVQLAAPKGSLPHRALGYLWVALMLVIGLTSFFVQNLRPGHFSFVHVISVVTLAVLPVAVLHARRGRVQRHRWAMIGLFGGSLVIAGAFTLLPGRIMHRVVFGGAGG